MKPLLTVEFHKTPEGVHIYCPELDIYTDGLNQADAERMFVSLLFEYYDALRLNRERLDDVMRSHLEFYERQFFPEMLWVMDEYPRLARELRKRFETPERQAESWEKILSSNLVKLSLA
ncbi:MAG: hypothetical protein ACETWR_03175 [Anaerolineae bacterium]